MFVGAFLGLMAIGMGAYTDHVLSKIADPVIMMMVGTALHYHLFHSVLVVSIGLSLFMPIPNKLYGCLKVCGWVFIVGILLFSFSIYLRAMTGIREFTNVTPLGGIILMMGWGLLAWTSFSKKR